MSIKIALLGAESTGKSSLAFELSERLNAQGLRSIAVAEYLREWCESSGRTPQREEQEAIAREQECRIEVAGTQADCVIADTTPLMIAVYSDHVFADKALYAQALAYQKTFDLTLLTALDLPWVADGLQREGAHVQEPVDALLRQALQSAAISYAVVHGQRQQRINNALNCINTIKSIANYSTNTTENGQNSTQTGLKPWQWQCEKCSEPDCEHRLFRRLLA